MANNRKSEFIPALHDIPVEYLTEKSQWHDFKRALVDLGLQWNLPDWSTTIVHKGRDWDDMVKAGADMERLFPLPRRGVVVDGKVEPVDIDLIELLGLPSSKNEKKNAAYFCNLGTFELESAKKLPARQKFWNWFIRNLKGIKPVAGPYYYIVTEVQVYDITGLYKRLCQVLEQITICSLDDELEIIIKLDFKPKSQSIFSYYSELRKAVNHLHDMNESLPEGARIVLPDAYLRGRLIRAARQVPVFKPVIDGLLVMPMKDWAKLKLTDLYTLLEQVCANDVAIENPGARRAEKQTDSIQANAVTVQQQQQQSDKPSTRICYGFAKGKCTSTNCRFSHATEPKPAPVKKG